MYSTLVRLNLVDGLKTIVQDAAQKFDVAPDGLTYTFTLRSGILFHDGTPLTADDVVATYNRMIFPPQGRRQPAQGSLHRRDQDRGARPADGEVHHEPAVGRSSCCC